MRRIIFFTYGLLCYLMFFGVVIYLVAFLGNISISQTLDSAPRRPMLIAGGINLLLLLVFAVQHSVMARPWFKRWWTRFVPQPVERSTYVLFSNVAMILIFAFWQPMSGIVWRVGGVGAKAVHALYALGWVTLLYATCLVNHFDLFGLRQVWLYLRNEPYLPLPFREPSLYRYIRHPLYAGWIMVFWFTPIMTASRLFFAVAITVYILIAVQFEERDLVETLPGYAEYRKRVAMLIPSWNAKSTINESDSDALKQV